MSRDTRTRSRFGSVPAGSFQGRYNGVDIGPFYNADHDISFNRGICFDSHGRPPTDSSLGIHKSDFSKLGTVNGVYAGGNPTWNGVAVEYYPQYIRYAGETHLSLPSMPSAAASVADLLARTSPSRPEYAPLTMLQDLVDVPKMLHEAGNFFKRGRGGKFRAPSLKDGASAYLGGLFGWVPLVEDITKVLEVHEHIDKRVQELKRLYSSKGLKRRIRLGTWGNASVTFPVMESYPVLFIATALSTQTVAERWGTVRWNPADTFPGYSPDNAEIIQRARDAVGGITTEGTFQGAWEVLPWTWLSDWGTNVKNYVLAHSNTVPATPSHVNVMTKTTTIRRPTVLSITPGYEWHPESYTYISKERYVGSAALDAHIPMLDMSRLSILAALAIQRLRR